MRSTRAALFFFITMFTVFAVHAQNFGSFVGKVVTEWLADGRRMKLVESFAYISPTNLHWDAPAGSVVDGASIPRFAWSFIGGPFEGKYREASVIHDVACETRDHPWEAVHDAFYWAMLASGVDSTKAKVMFAAVYHFGPRWITVVEEVSEKGHAADTVKSVKSTFAKGTTFTVSSKEVQVDYKAGLPYQAELVTVTAKPPLPNLKERDFDKLKQAIETNELSLEQIRDFKVK